MNVFRGAVSRNLILSLAALTILSLVMGGVAYFYTQRILAVETETIKHADMRYLRTRIRAESLLLSDLTREYALQTQPEARLRSRIMFDDSARRLARLFEQITILDADEQRKVEHAHALVNSYVEQAQALMATIEQEGYYGTLAQATMMNLSAQRAPLLDALIELEDLETSRLDQARRQAKSTAQSVSTSLLIIGSAIVALAVAIGTFNARNILVPLAIIQRGVEAVTAGQLDHPIEIRRRDEFGILADAFNKMTTELRQSYESLEQRVAQRTAQLRAGAQVARAASSILDPQALMQQTVDLICDQFGYYYAAIFLLDQDPPPGQPPYARLRAGRGEPGQIMLARGHKFELGSGMVGWVCANNKARIALDVGQDAVRFANPLLPNTRSEIALPLQVGGRILGALDVQSEQPAAFDESDIAVLQSMADQIAVALENARLFQQVQTSLQELEQANRLLTQQGWEAFLHTRPPTFAEFHQAGAAPFTPEEIQAGDQPPTRATIPIQVRGQIIGTLVAERRPDQPEWSEADLQVLQAAVAQAAQAMDSARLFDASQRLAARERVVSRVSSRMRESLDLETVLRTTADEIYQTLGLERVAIRLAVSASQARPAQEE